MTKNLYIFSENIQKSSEDTQHHYFFLIVILKSQLILFIYLLYFIKLFTFIDLDIIKVIWRSQQNELAITKY